MVALNPNPTDYDSFVDHLAIDYRARRAHWHLRLSGPAAVPALRRGLAHPDARVRRGCVEILDHLLDDDTVEDIVGALGDPDPEVAARALHALACDRCKVGACRPGESVFVPKAQDLLAHHPEARVRFAAVDALGKVVHLHPELQASLTTAATEDPARSVRKAAQLRLPGGSIYERTRPRQRRTRP